MVEATRPVSPGVSFMAETEYRFMIAGAEDEPSADITAAYEAAFGSPPLGSKIFVRSRVLKRFTPGEGLTSAWLYAAAIVVPP